MKKNATLATLFAAALLLAACARRVPLDRRLPVPGVFGTPAAEAVEAAEPAPADVPAPVEEPAPAGEAAAEPEEAAADMSAEEIAEPLVEIIPEDAVVPEEAVPEEALEGEDDDSGAEIGQIEAKLAEISGKLDEIEAIEPENGGNPAGNGEILPGPPKIESIPADPVPEIGLLPPVDAVNPSEEDGLTPPDPGIGSDLPENPGVEAEPGVPAAGDGPEIPELALETPEIEPETPEIPAEPAVAPLPPPDERPAADLATRREALFEATAADEPAADDGDIESLIAEHEAAIAEADALAAAIAEAEDALALPDLP